MQKLRNLSFAVLSMALIISLVGMVGCQGDGTDEQTANLVYVNWAEGVAYTHLAQAVLQERMGYDCTITSADVGPAYTSIANGDQDAFMETWLPTLHRNYVERYQDDIVDLGHVYEGTQSGLVVPTYVTIDSVSQLNAHSDRFDGEIVGIDAGAGIMQTTEQLIGDYSLDLELLSSSGPAMTSALSRAVSNEEWIVVTGWKPHWMFARWDLKFLKQDADKMLWKPGNIHIMGRENIRQDKPELARFLENMRLTDVQLADLMLKVRESDSDISEVAHTWMQNNTDVIDTWIPEGAM